MKEIIVIIIIVLAITTGILVLSNCDSCEGKETRTESSYESTYKPNKAGGMGMTYGGKMGIDLGGGLVMPFSGGGIGLGIGF